MDQDAKLFVGLDVAKLHHAVAVAVAVDGRDGEVRYIGEINADPTSVRRTVCKFEKRRLPIHFCFEAGPTGYALYRQIYAMGHECSVIAPSSIPTRPGDRIKTNRRDALQLARLLRAGELTPVWVPDEAHEAIRELVRIRETVLEDLKRKRQSIMSLMLRNGRTYPGRTTWSKSHLYWLQEQRFEHPAQHLNLQEMLLAARHAAERLKRTGGFIEEFLPGWSLAPTVTALQALRGVRLITATTIMVEIGDLSRFSNSRQLMGFLGLVPESVPQAIVARRSG